MIVLFFKWATGVKQLTGATSHLDISDPCDAVNVKLIPEMPPRYPTTHVVWRSAETVALVPQWAPSIVQAPMIMHD